MKRKTWPPGKMRCSEHKENWDYQSNVKNVTFTNGTVMANSGGSSTFHFNYKSDGDNTEAYE